MRKHLLHIIVVGLLIGFFGYVGYRDMVYDKSTVIEHKLVAAKTVTTETTATQNPAETAKQLGYQRAAIAVQEYQKNVYEAPRGCNCGPEVDKYTEGLHAQWCTMFVSWVTKEAGAPLKDDKTGSWKLTNSRQLATYLEKHGTWYSAAEAQQKNLQPRVGDMVIFWRGDFEDNLGHATIVVNIDKADGTADLVGGNQKDHVALSQDFPWLHNYGLLGFGRPEKD